MKKLIKSSYAQSDKATVKIVMYLRPQIYSDFCGVSAAVSFDNSNHRYHTDINPARILNGPLSEYGQVLEEPILDEYKSFIEDCIWLIKETGFTVIDEYTSAGSEKSEYVLTFGIDDSPCGTLVYDLRISDHPFDATFPEEWKDKALQYLQINKVLDGSATKAGIDFEVEKVTVGSVKSDTWDKAFNRLYLVLRKMRRAVKIRLNR